MPWFYQKQKCRYICHGFTKNKNVDNICHGFTKNKNVDTYAMVLPKKIDTFACIMV